MKVILILFAFIQIGFASELVAVFDMPNNSRYKLVPSNANMILLKKSKVKNTMKVVSAEPILKVSGVFTVGSSYSALINGEVYSLNDIVSGYKIKAININSVTLIKKGKKVIVYVENN